MLTWVWLARASHKLTKPKSTFAAPKIFCRACVRHTNKVSPLPTGALVLPGQLSPRGSCPPGAVVAWAVVTWADVAWADVAWADVAWAVVGASYKKLNEIGPKSLSLI